MNVGQMTCVIWAAVLYKEIFMFLRLHKEYFGFCIFVFTFYLKAAFVLY